MPLNTAFFPCLLINLSIDILAVCLIDKQCFTGKQNLNYKIYWEKKIDEQDWLQFFCNEFPPKRHLLLSKLRTQFNNPIAKLSSSPKLLNMIFLACCQTYSTKFIYSNCECMLYRISSTRYLLQWPDWCTHKSLSPAAYFLHPLHQQRMSHSDHHETHCNR